MVSFSHATPPWHLGPPCGIPAASWQCRGQARRCSASQSVVAGPSADRWSCLAPARGCVMPNTIVQRMCFFFRRNFVSLDQTKFPNKTYSTTPLTPRTRSCGMPWPTSRTRACPWPGACRRLAERRASQNDCSPTAPIADDLGRDARGAGRQSAGP
jgi:hypothetical protein